MLAEITDPTELAEILQEQKPFEAEDCSNTTDFASNNCFCG
ncbi:MAG: hypothetical protein PHG19_02255 [Anaerotignum sp.]|nr:hypothetical protein [Anaerotignum sp.]